MKKIYVNLKDWFNLEENISFSERIANSGVVVFPALPYLHLYSNISGVEIGTQDASSYSTGAHTGSISAEHLKDFNVKWVILNHKELKITDYQILRDKIINSLTNGVKIVLCINSVQEKELSLVKEVLVDLENYDNIIIAYEPEEEIDIESVKTDINAIKNYLSNSLDVNFEMIFGGSVSKENISIYKDEINISGFLISRHALNVSELKTMINLVK